jgi:hypothetical protein
MKSGTAFLVFAATALAASILAAPPASADALAIPVTAGIVEQASSAVAPIIEPLETASGLLTPYSDEIDQNQPSGPVYMAAFSQTCLAQSFMQTHSNISGAGILLQAAVGSSDNVTIQLWTGLPNAGGTMLVQASATGTAGQWVDVYWDAVSITPATTYYLVFTGNTSLGIAGSTSNPYPNGCVYANPGYTQFATFDYAFRTYYDTEVAIVRDTWGSLKTLFE